MGTGFKQLDVVDTLERFQHASRRALLLDWGGTLTPPDAGLYDERDTADGQVQSAPHPCTPTPASLLFLALPLLASPPSSPASPPASDAPLPLLSPSPRHHHPSALVTPPTHTHFGVPPPPLWPPGCSRTGASRLNCAVCRPEERGHDRVGAIQGQGGVRKVVAGVPLKDVARGGFALGGGEGEAEMGMW
eukprot:scaffold2427_cov71-Isochrysis_galbana.AAC.2